MIAVDTSAIMAMLMGEERTPEIIECLADHDLCISVGTLSELMIVATARGLLEEVEEVIASIAIEVVPVDGLTARQIQQAFANWGKGRNKASLNFGDCFAYVLAKYRNIPLLFVGNNFSETDLVCALQ